MNENIEKVIFPQNNRKETTNFFYDDVGLYSISIVKDAKMTTQFIVGELHKRNINPKKLTILEGTGGLGGNAISFCFAFKNVIVYELDKDRYKLLKKNMSNYLFTNYQILNENSIEKLSNQIADIFFFDPPWGGPDYKSQDKIRLSLGDKSLFEITNQIKKLNSKAFISFKLPYNYDIDEFKDYNYSTIEIRNCLILLILP